MHEVLDRVDSGDPLIADNEIKRSKRFQASMPRSICRHILLSNIKGVIALTDVSFLFTLIFSYLIRIALGH